MNPKKPKEFIKPTADALGHPEQLVDDIVGFYWTAVRKEFSELESPSITVTNLGIFKVRYNKIEKAQTRYTNYVNKIEANKMTFNKHTLLNIFKNKLQKLIELKNKMEDEFRRQKIVKNKRKKYVTDKTLEK